MVDLKIKLPDSFFEPEERYGYVTSRKMKELWAVELDLLCEFDRVCKKLGLQYFLDGGTLLGAVRDGRFIPWDDDIDTSMLREEYDKLLKYGPSEFKAPYFFQNAYTDVDYRRGLSQLRRNGTTYLLKRELTKKLPFNQGICIDIFPLDGLPATGEVDAFFEEKQTVRRKITQHTKSGEHDPKVTRELFRQYDEICRRYSHSEQLGEVMFRRDTQSLCVFQREWFSKSVPITFEGMFFPAPLGYDGVLRSYYGANYIVPMTLDTNHGEIIMDTERDYSAVLAEFRENSEGN